MHIGANIPTRTSLVIFGISKACMCVKWPLCEWESVFYLMYLTVRLFYHTPCSSVCACVFVGHLRAEVSRLQPGTNL